MSEFRQRASAFVRQHPLLVPLVWVLLVAAILFGADRLLPPGGLVPEGVGVIRNEPEHLGGGHRRFEFIDGRSLRTTPEDTTVLSGSETYSRALVLYGSFHNSLAEPNRRWLVIVPWLPVHSGLTNGPHCFHLQTQASDHGTSILTDLGLILPKSEDFEPGPGWPDGDRYSEVHFDAEPYAFCLNTRGEVEAYLSNSFLYTYCPSVPEPECVFDDPYAGWVGGATGSGRNSPAERRAVGTLGTCSACSADAILRLRPTRVSP